MASLIVTPLATSVLAILFVLLSGRVIQLRRRDAVGIGYGKSHDLRRAIRVHGNFGEYVPLAIVVLALLEASAMMPPWLLWALAGVLLVSRILHAAGLSRSAGTSLGRFIGTGLTLVYLLVAGGALVFIGVHNAMVG